VGGPGGESGEQDLPALRIGFNRPEVRNAFRPQTVDELYRALDHARMTADVGTIILTGNGPAAGGHSLNVVADLSIASREHARFKQTDANVGSFDAGYGSALLARQVGDKRAREIFFLAREYSADDAERWGVVNEAVPHAELEARALEHARIIATKSPQAIRMLKFAFNLADDGLAGQQVFAGEATRMAYMTDEAQEGRDAFLQRRDPDWTGFPYAF